jgi:predicted ATP-grasp superfamily ATP-dependent carboligase
MFYRSLSIHLNFALVNTFFKLWLKCHKITLFLGHFVRYYPSKDIYLLCFVEIVSNVSN